MITKNERMLWLQLLLAVAVCLVLVWLIGFDRVVSGADIVRDRLFLGVGR